jgi:hypothetical protein
MDFLDQVSPEELNQEIDSVYTELEQGGLTRRRAVVAEPVQQPAVAPQPQPSESIEISAPKLQTPEQPNQPALSPAQDALAPSTQELGAEDYLLDAATGAARGVAGAVESVADLVAFGALPNDLLTQYLPKTKTAVGGFVEVGTEFAVGFIPVFGQINKAAKLGKLARMGSIGRWLQKSEIGRGAVAGAVADFSVFDEHEERLSNLIQGVPGLENPVTEYLAADKDDSLLEGRIKNVLEGVMVGGVVDGIMLGIKALKKSRNLAEAGKTTEAEKVLEEAGKQIDPLVKSARESAQVMETELGRQDQLRQSIEGAEGLKQDLAQGQTLLGRDAPINQFASPQELRGAFDQRGEGHAKFTKRLDLLVEDKGLTENGKDLIIGTLWKAETNDEYLKNLEVATLTSKSTSLGRGGVIETKVLKEGEVFPGWKPLLTLKKALADKYKVNEKDAETLSTFWHEYGHSGYYSLLSPEQKRLVTDAYSATTRSQRVNFFREGIGGGRKTSDPDFYPKYYAKNETEWFAQSFAEYVIKNKTEHKDLVAVFEEMLTKIKESLSSLFGRKDPATLNDIFEYILKGENYGKKPTWGGWKLSTLELAEKTPRYTDAKFMARARTIGADPGEYGRVLPEVSPETRKRFENYVKIFEANPTDLQNLAKAWVDDSGRPVFNLEDFKDTETAHRASLALMETFADVLEKAKGPVRTQEVVAKEALDFIKKMDGGNAVLSRLAKDARNERHLDARIRAYYGMAVALKDKQGQHTAEFLRARDWLLKSPNDPTILKKYAESYLAATQVQDNLREVLFGYQTVRSAAGRNLNVFKQIKETTTLVEYAKSLMEQAGGKEQVEITLEKLDKLYSKHGAAGLVSQAPVSALDMHNELWINFLLSGPRTFAVNALSTGINTMLKPITSALGSYRMYQKTGDTKYKMMADEFINVYGYMMDSWKEAMELGMKAFKEGDSILQRSSSPIEKGPAITGENVTKLLGQEREANPVLAGISDFFGTVVRTPSRILNGTDEFFKQINYRSYAKAKATIEAMEALGEKSTDPKAVAEWVNARLSNIIMGDGRRYTKKAVRAQAVVEAARQFGDDVNGLEAADFIADYVSKNWDSSRGALSDYAFDVAQEVTFTRRGERNPLTGKASFQLFLERAASNHPALRLVVPFVTTPMNILKMVGQYTYGAAVYGAGLEKIPFLGAEKLRLARELASGDPMVEAAARGKIYVGLGLSSTAVMAAISGTITGGGPADENEKKIKMQTGWRPYSIKVGDQYISYQRLDPFASFLGLAADLAERSMALKAQDENALQTSMAAMAVAISRNITNKSYLAGIEQITDALSQPERFAPRLLQNRLGSYIPSAVSQAVGSFGDDPYMREARGWFDTVFRRLPGASRTVDPTRNILGEKVERTGIAPGIDYVNPIVVSSYKKDKIMDEIASLEHGFTLPRPIQDGGLDLTQYENNKGQTAYDRWLELQSEIRINGRTLRQALDKLIANGRYQKLSSELIDDFDSPRTREIRKVLSTYRARAKEAMLREFPDVSQQVNTATRVKLALRRGQSVEELLSQLKQ